MKKIIFTLVSMVVSFSANAENYRDPDVSEIYQRLRPAASSESLPQKLNVLVWNVHKGLDGQKWVNDFTRLAQNKDLILLQEGMNDEISKSAYFSNQDFGWWMGVAYIETTTQVLSGVVTGSPYSPTRHKYFLSQGKEPVSQTGHTILASHFPQGHRDFLVVNVHALNFVRNKLWHLQMDEMEKLLVDHSGPGIVAGDFNTWNSGRTKSLDQRLAKHGYKKVILANDKRKLKLDHVYLKGCEARKAELFSNIKSSDHAPILLQMKCF